MAKSRGGDGDIELSVSTILDTSKVDAALGKLKDRIQKNEQSYVSLGNKLRIAWESSARGVGVASQAVANLSSKVASLRQMVSGGWLGAGLKIGTGMFVFDKLKDGLMSIPRAFWAAVNDASQVEIIDRKFRAVFDNMAPEARKFAQGFAKELGRSESDIKQIMSRFQDQLVPSGFSREKALEMSKMLTRLSADLAASEGIGQREVMDRIVSGISGNHEALRLFGTMVTEKSLDTELRGSGVGGGLKDATELEKILGRINILLKSTRDAQGMAKSATGSFAMESEALASAWTDLSATIGKLFLPSLAKLTAFFREFAAKARAALGDTGMIGKSLGDTFGRVLELVKPAQEYVLSFVKKLGQGLEMLAAKAKEFGERFTNWDSFIDSLNGAIAKIGSAIYDTIRDAIRDGIKAGFDFSPSASGVASGAMSFGASVARGMMRTVESGGIPTVGGGTPLSDAMPMGMPASEGGPAKPSGPLDILRGLGGLFSGTLPSGPQSSDADKAWKEKTMEQKRESLRARGASQQLLDSGTEAELDWFNSQQSGDGYNTFGIRSGRGLSNSGALGRLQDGLRAATGLDMRANEWSGMSTEEKRKKVYELWKRNSPSKESFNERIEKLGDLNDRSLTAQMLRFSRGKNLLGGIEKDAQALLAPKDNSSPFTASNGPFDRLGSIVGGLTNGFQDAIKAGVQAFADPEKVASEQRARGQVQFMGLQDIGKQLQQAIGDDEARKDKIKIELAKKQQAAAETAAEHLRNMPANIANEFSRLIGLQ